MPFELKNDDGNLDLTLSGRLGVQQATPLWTAVRPVLLAGDPIRLLAGDLEEMDTSIVQILCKLGQAKDQRPARMQIAQVSDGFIRSLKRAGLEKFFVQAASTNRAEPSQPVTPKAVTVALAEDAVLANAVPEDRVSAGAVLTISEAPPDAGADPEAFEAGLPEPAQETAPVNPAAKKRSTAKSTSGSRLSA